MKRTFAVVALLAAIGVFSKLALKPGAPLAGPRPDGASIAGKPELSQVATDPRSTLTSRYAGSPASTRELVERVADRFRQTAVAVERTDGLRGLRLLDRLDLEAVYLYEKHPKEFRRLREILDDDSAAEVLLHWREYFGLKRADDTDRSILVSELAHLSRSQRRLAARYPSALPLILADPEGVAELVESFRGDDKGLEDSLVVLSLISLESGAADLRTALRTLENHRNLALDAFRRHGLEGFGLIALYGPIVEAVGSSLSLDDALILLRVNSDYVDELLRTHRPETVASHLSHVAASGLVAPVGGSPHALRLVVEFGVPGEKALTHAGPDAADVVYGDFADPLLRKRAVEALGAYGPMALVILDKYAVDADFRDVLRTHGGAVIPAIAQADASPEALALLQSKERRSLQESLAKLALLASGDNGQSVIRTIRKDGLERVAYLYQSGVQVQQFLPLYDVLHLGNLLRRGHTPTSGEITWALVDGCFVVVDLLSLAAIQPGAAVAAEAVHSELKSAAREGARSIGRELLEQGGESAGKTLQAGRALPGVGTAVSGGVEAVAGRAARWWTVRSAGGVYQVLQRLPDALPRMSVAQVVGMARPLCARAGMRLSTWRPVQLLREGVAIPFRIPPERGLKYLAAQLVQASVGVVGFQKMEEHLASRRPRRPEAGGVPVAQLGLP
ncbi:MAG: hypothetical protein U0790_01695 [Isosphaeraceae bacterium]